LTKELCDSYCGGYTRGYSPEKGHYFQCTYLIRYEHTITLAGSKRMVRKDIPELEIDDITGNPVKHRRCKYRRKDGDLHR